MKKDRLRENKKIKNVIENENKFLIKKPVVIKNKFIFG